VHSQTAARDLPFLPTLAKPQTTAIRILIADGHPVIREGLVAIFESQKDMKVIAEAADGQRACERCYQLCPDVLLLDLRITASSIVEGHFLPMRKKPDARGAYLVNLLPYLRANDFGWSPITVPSEGIATVLYQSK
jgi:hypothetical protein